MTYTYTLEITPTWSTIDNTLLSFVSKERQQKVKKYVFDADKKLSLYAALLTRMQLSLYTQIPFNELSFSYTSLNKPFLQSVSNCHFNISHTRNRILLGVSSMPVGVDIEPISKAPINIMDMVFHPNEIEHVSNATSDSEKNLRFFSLWTRKEALTKCLGIGLTNKPASYDTLSKKYLSNFHTWNEDGYMCSVYKEKLESLSHTIITEENIHSFYSFPKVF